MDSRPNSQTGPYHVVDVTPSRRVWLNTLDMSWRTHSIYGLLEVDATVPRQFIAAHKALTGEKLSFTGYITYCLARALDEDKAVQAYLKGRKQMVIFDDVNVGLMVEGNIGEKRTLMGHVIQGANRKTYQEIHQEIRAVQSRSVPPGRGMPAWFRKVMLLPWPLSKMVRALLTMYMSRNPVVPVAMAGTVSVTAIGMFGQGHSGWGISPTPSSIALVVGSTAWKPAIVNGRIEPREILHLTVMFDHDIVDGGPAARFTQRLVELIESGYGLDEPQVVIAFDTEATTEPASHAGSDIH